MIGKYTVRPFDPMGTDIILASGIPPRKNKGLEIGQHRWNEKVKSNQENFDICTRRENPSISHRINGTGIFTLRLVDFYGFHVGKYTTTSMGFVVLGSELCFIRQHQRRETFFFSPGLRPFSKDW